MIKKIYYHAVDKSDPRLISLHHRSDSRTTRMWGWIARALETCWVPLWLDYEELRENSFDRALEDTAKRNRIRKQFLPSLPPIAEKSRIEEDEDDNKETAGRYEKVDEPKR
jgi:hypothetical protein